MMTIVPMSIDTLLVLNSWSDELADFCSLGNPLGVVDTVVSWLAGQRRVAHGRNLSAFHQLKEPVHRRLVRKHEVGNT